MPRGAGIAHDGPTVRAIDPLAFTPQPLPASYRPGVIQHAAGSTREQRLGLVKTNLIRDYDAIRTWAAMQTPLEDPETGKRVAPWDAEWEGGGADGRAQTQAQAQGPGPELGLSTPAPLQVPPPVVQPVGGRGGGGNLFRSQGTQRSKGSEGSRGSRGSARSQGSQGTMHSQRGPGLELPRNPFDTPTGSVRSSSPVAVVSRWRQAVASEEVLLEAEMGFDDTDAGQNPAARSVRDTVAFYSDLARRPA